MINKIMKIINGTMGIFVYGILSKWYLAIAIPAMTTTYIIFKKLYEKGILDKLQAEIEKDLIILEYIVERCMPKIGNINDLIKCFNF
ncbi:DUF2670 domain-containing protein [Rickettsia endosymbiont of Cardiosporidium cionae]|uniref:DUF2670 domain-containing protein n=1 Tax=Rickettsia endosymbiont of Cardiosporidium cionae TaxID=2777155 RepID=UPI00189461FC|nr:DUF2670 domain-containing protein [Rickettsia endosymbiont of Cardiosporidium cionae]